MALLDMVSNSPALQLADNLMAQVSSQISVGIPVLYKLSAVYLPIGPRLAAADPARRIQAIQL